MQRSNEQLKVPICCEPAEFGSLYSVQAVFLQEDSTYGRSFVASRNVFEGGFLLEGVFEPLCVLRDPAGPWVGLDVTICTQISNPGISLVGGRGVRHVQECVEYCASSFAA